MAAFNILCCLSMVDTKRDFFSIIRWFSSKLNTNTCGRSVIGRTDKLQKLGHEENCPNTFTPHLHILVAVLSQRFTQLKSTLAAGVFPGKPQQPHPWQRPAGATKNEKQFSVSDRDNHIPLRCCLKL